MLIEVTSELLLIILAKNCAIGSEAADESLHPYQKKVLKSAVGHWEGLTVFVKYPEVPIDNNEVERNIRVVALQRNNFLGSSFPKK